ncbi:MAG: DUF1493 family protein [Pseudomonadota bacterium]
MDTIEAAREFVAEACDYPDYLSPSDDILRKLRITGDDTDDFMIEFGQRFDVDLSNYNWYFHTEEEGYSIGSLFFKSLDRRVARIPITLEILANSIETKKWSVHYPEHTLPPFRKDLAVDRTLVIVALIFAIWVFFF